MARLEEDLLFAPNRELKPGVGAAKLVDDPLFAPNRDPKPGAGTARLVEDPLFAPNRVRRLASEACGFTRRLSWLPPNAGLPRSIMLAAARLCVS